MKRLLSGWYANHFKFNINKIKVGKFWFANAVKKKKRRNSWYHRSVQTLKDRIHGTFLELIVSYVSSCYMFLFPKALFCSVCVEVASPSLPCFFLILPIGSLLAVLAPLRFPYLGGSPVISCLLFFNWISPPLLLPKHHSVITKI